MLRQTVFLIPVKAEAPVSEAPLSLPSNNYRDLHWAVCMQMIQRWWDLQSSGTTDSEEASGWPSKQTACYTATWKKNKLTFEFIHSSYSIISPYRRMQQHICMSLMWIQERVVYCPPLLSYIFILKFVSTKLFDGRRGVPWALVWSRTALGVRTTDKSLCFAGGSPLFIYTQGPKETVHRLSTHCTTMETYECTWTNTPTLTFYW